MEPISSTLAAVSCAFYISTARQKYEPCITIEKNITQLASPAIYDSFESIKPSTFSNDVYKVDNSSVRDDIKIVISEIDKLANLSDDWNGEGAIALDKGIAFDARLFIKKYPKNMPIPAPMLTEEGEFSFYWNSDIAYIDMQLEGNGVASFYIHNRTTKKDSFFQESWYDQSEAWFEAVINKTISG